MTLADRTRDLIVYLIGLAIGLAILGYLAVVNEWTWFCLMFLVFLAWAWPHRTLRQHVRQRGGLPDSLRVEWIQQDFYELYTAAVSGRGVYVIWFAGDVAPIVLCASQGRLRREFRRLRASDEFGSWRRKGPILVAWTTRRNPGERDGIERYVGDEYRPVMDAERPYVDPIPGQPANRHGDSQMIRALFGILAIAQWAMAFILMILLAIEIANIRGLVHPMEMFRLTAPLDIGIITVLLLSAIFCELVVAHRDRETAQKKRAAEAAREVGRDSEDPPEEL